MSAAPTEPGVYSTPTAASALTSTALWKFQKCQLLDSPNGRHCFSYALKTPDQGPGREVTQVRWFPTSAWLTTPPWVPGLLPAPFILEALTPGDLAGQNFLFQRLDRFLFQLPFPCLEHCSPNCNHSYLKVVAVILA